MLCDLRDSGSIEQDADIVGLLHQPDPDANGVELHIDNFRDSKPEQPSLQDGLSFWATSVYPLHKAIDSSELHWPAWGNTIVFEVATGPDSARRISRSLRGQPGASLRPDPPSPSPG